MKKPASFRAALEAAIPDLKRDADRLKVHIESGRIAAGAGRSESFEYAYVLVALIEEFTGNPDIIFGTVIQWLRMHQFELLQNRDLMTDALSFDVDIINGTTCDVLIKLRLTERAVQTRHGWENPPEPVLPEDWPEDWPEDGHV